MCDTRKKKPYGNIASYFSDVDTKKPVNQTHELKYTLRLMTQVIL